MTETEARTVALLRMHFRCSHEDIATCCQAIWDADRCEEITGYRHGKHMGKEMVLAMEDFFQLGRGQSESMDMWEQKCYSCGNTQVAISYIKDTPKQCGFCGEFDTLWCENEEDKSN